VEREGGEMTEQEAIESLREKLNHADHVAVLWFVIAILFATATMVFVVISISQKIDSDTLKAKAIRLGHAEYVPDANNQPSFEWKVKAEKPQ
jgi:hypothetical protein